MVADIRETAFGRIIFNDSGMSFSEIKGELTEANQRLFDIHDDAQVALWSYSMSNYYPLFADILDLIKPQSFCEIGVYRGWGTKLYIKLCDKYNARLHCIDPFFEADLLPPASEKLSYFNETSRQYFERNITSDIYFIDGEHTYEAVHHDLTKIQSLHQDRKCIIFLHDMNWPHSYRDVIMNRQDYLHKERPCGRGYIFPTSEGFTNVGMPMFYADITENEGGPGNGLLNAVETFLSDFAEWDFAKIPSVYGLGILWNPTLMTDKERRYLEFKKAQLQTFSPFLSYLELHRLLTMAKMSLDEQNLNSLQSDLNVLTAASASLAEQTEALRQQNDSLQDQLQTAITDRDNHARNCRSLLDSNSWKITAPLRFIKSFITRK